MNRSEAFVAIHEGHKVTHQNFTSKEYLHIVNGKVHTEDGYDFEDKFFETDFFEDGWSIYEESNRVVVTCSGSHTLRNTVEFIDDISVEKEPKPWYNQHGNKRSIFRGKK